MQMIAQRMQFKNTYGSHDKIQGIPLPRPLRVSLGPRVRPFVLKVNAVDKTKDGDNHFRSNPMNVKTHFADREKDTNAGVAIAIALMISWSVVFYICVFRLDLSSTPVDESLIAVLIMTHLYTGIFITAHDAMHGSVSDDRAANDLIGHICCFLYAGFWFPTMRRKHTEHHEYVCMPFKDPDYHRGNPNFIVWFFHFMGNYMSIQVMVTLYLMVQGLIALGAEDRNLVVFMAGAGLLSGMQLFYYGTYLPHRPPETEPFARTSRKTHCKSWMQSFIECYHFGCHHEHHENPRVPWWLLWNVANPK